MLYFAYGSNLNLAQMRYRCPAARIVGRFTLPNARLVFRMVADCIAEEGSECPGGLWEITPECERELDRFEGVTLSGDGSYYKDYFTVTTPEGIHQVLIYRSNSGGIYPPSENYFRTIEQGYKEFGLPLEALRAARDHAWVEKNPTWHERRRLQGRGYISLAQPTPVAPVKSKKRRGGAKAASRGRSLLNDPVDDLFAHDERPPRQQRGAGPRGAKSLKEWMDERYGRY